VPVTPTFPGVYIEEVPSGVHPITGVATSIAAFVDFFQRGPMNEAVEIFSFADFERVFGGLDTRSEASYAIQQFFLNGGTHAWVVRVATAGTGGNTPTKATVKAARESSATDALTFTAVNEGEWGNNIRVRVDWGTSDPTTLFNLTVAEVLIRDNRAIVVSSEEFKELSMDSTDPRYAQAIVDAGSALIRLTTNGSPLPAPSGSMTTADFATVSGASEKLVKVKFTYNDGGSPASDEKDDVSLGTGPIATIDDAAGRLEAALRAANPTDPSWAAATVKVMGERLQVLPGLARPATVASFAAASADGTTAGALNLPASGVAAANVAAYSVGSTTSLGKQLAGTAGKDGIPPKGSDLIGSGAATPPTGLHALDKVDLFNILCLPRIARVAGITNAFPSADVSSALTNAINYCESRRAFFVVDTPSDVNNVIEFKAWLSTTLDAVRNKNAAVYFPRTVSGDPLDDFRPRTFGASGTMAGIYSRIDATRGVWKAPAGTEATLANVQRFDYKLSDPENGVLNPLGINCLRTFDVYGNVSWGARTLDGADAKASEWKYVPVRRFALFLEESLYRGTKWVVFEPNDEPLWAQIRLNVGAFMHNLFRQGAFQGTTPKEAYFVKCDKETTTQTDINNGVVNILVGFAPLKPAEFVIIKIQQLAGQIET
jgi:Bacteriophage tail sheath protein